MLEVDIEIPDPERRFGVADEVVDAAGHVQDLPDSYRAVDVRHRRKPFRQGIVEREHPFLDQLQCQRRLEVLLRARDIEQHVSRERDPLVGDAGSARPHPAVGKEDRGRDADRPAAGERAVKGRLQRRAGRHYGLSLLLAGDDNSHSTQSKYRQRTFHGITPLQPLSESSRFR